MSIKGSEWFMIVTVRWHFRGTKMEVAACDEEFETY